MILEKFLSLNNNSKEKFPKIKLNKSVILFPQMHYPAIFPLVLLSAPNL